MKPYPFPGTLAYRFLELSKRPTGVSTTEFMAHHASRFGHLTQKLTDRGFIHRAEASCRNVRYFTNPLDAKAWLKEATKPVQLAVHMPPPVAFEPAAKVIYPTHPDGTPAYRLTTYRLPAQYRAASGWGVEA